MHQVQEARSGSSIHFSRHAETRKAQRAIPAKIVAQLLVAGKREFDHRGGIRVHLHSRVAQQRFAELAGVHAAAQFCNVYIVVDSRDPSFVITAGWRSLHRHRDPAPRR
jgi:hypothetical protein